jgi:hypothetical protein
MMKRHWGNLHATARLGLGKKVVPKPLPRTFGLVEKSLEGGTGENLSAERFPPI